MLIQTAGNSTPYCVFQRFLSMKMFLRSLVPLWLLCCFAGCGNGPASESTVSQTEAGYETGLKAFEEGDFNSAESTLAAAISNGTLQPDLTESAIRTLARARVALGKLPEAEADLKQLQAGAMEMDQFWVAMAELELKKGNNAEAKKAIQQARTTNPRLVLPKPLASL